VAGFWALKNLGRSVNAGAKGNLNAQGFLAAFSDKCILG